MKILVISLGCDKNLVDTEVMLAMLEGAGHTVTNDENEAEAVLINTCCFIGDAKEESVNTILDMADLKNSGQIRKIIVSGCLSERYKKEILDEIPEVDAVLGTASYDHILEALEETENGEKAMFYDPLSRLPESPEGRLLTTGGHYAYLKIAEGCDKHCTYCIIPKIRGSYRSFPMERLVAEARSLASGGVKEIILVAQETTLYGTDLYGKKMLPELLRRLAEIPELYWIRILYCYPEEIDDELIQVMKEEKKVCHYLDLPIQHASDGVLKRMNRRTNRKDLEEIVGRLRREIPDICLRTTLIAGFPGETPADHEEVLGFVEEMAFDRLGCFAYSREEDTPAYKMPNQVDEETALDYQAEIMALQQEIAFKKAEERIGETLLVMIEGKVADENAYVGRTYRDAPGVDGLIFINTEETLMSGDFVYARVIGALEYDLIGEIVENT